MVEINPAYGGIMINDSYIEWNNTYRGRSGYVIWGSFIIKIGPIIITNREP